MKSSRSRAQIKQRVLQVVYITFTLAVVGMMFYLNYRHDNNIKQNQRRIAFFQEQIGTDSRFKNIRLQIDTEMAVSILSGSVASKEDFKALTVMISTMPAFAGTRGWKYDIEIKGLGIQRTPVAE